MGKIMVMSFRDEQKEFAGRLFGERAVQKPDDNGGDGIPEEQSAVAKFGDIMLAAKERYHFKVGDIRVKVRFANTGDSLQVALIKAVRSS